MAYVKGSSRVLRAPEVFEVFGRNGRPVLIEVPSGTRVRLNVTELPSFDGPPEHEIAAFA